MGGVVRRGRLLSWGRYEFGGTTCQGCVSTGVGWGASHPIFPGAHPSSGLCRSAVVAVEPALDCALERSRRPPVKLRMTGRVHRQGNIRTVICPTGFPPTAPAACCIGGNGGAVEVDACSNHSLKAGLIECFGQPHLSA